MNRRAADTPDATLRHSQIWFLNAVTAPESITASDNALAAEQMLTRGPRLSALERLEIYRHGYLARLVECLADDYPVLKHALGKEAFEQLCRQYVAQHPSERPNLNAFGCKMADFCRSALSLPAPAGFAADLATLEWAIVEVIHAPASKPMTLEGLAKMPMDEWARARLIPNTAFRLLRLGYPVNAYLQAVKGGSNPPIPEPATSATVVYRNSSTVWRIGLTEAMFAVLSSLVEGESLADSVSRAESSFADIDEKDAEQWVMGWFREWVSSGLFVGVQTTG